MDPLDATADICARHGVWMHVDGAYGAPAAAAPSTAALFAGLDRADSVTVDVHKWLGHAEELQPGPAAHARRAGRRLPPRGRAPAARGRRGQPRRPNAGVVAPDPSLTLWLAFRTYGADAFRSWIERTLGHARALADAVDAEPSLQLLRRPTLSTVNLRHRPSDTTDLDAHNLRLSRAIQDEGRVYLAPATVDGRVYLRVCFTNFRTTSEDVTEILAIVRELGHRLAAAR